jgi:molybdenum cofactor biosynthesis enzyme MoaA
VKWEDEELAELDKLRELLYEVSALNRGNCVIERMQKVIAIADELRTSRWKLTDEGERALCFFEKLEQDARDYWRRKRELERAKRAITGDAE